jgi:hypothetical protein
MSDNGDAKVSKEFVQRFIDAAGGVQQVHNEVAGSMGRKDSAGKERLDLLPPLAMLRLSRVLGYGVMEKYADKPSDNWLRVPQAKTQYYAAALRHLLKYAAGEERDPESGQHHLAHALCDIAFVLELECREGNA